MTLDTSTDLSDLLLAAGLTVGSRKELETGHAHELMTESTLVKGRIPLDREIFDIADKSEIKNYIKIVIDGFIVRYYQTFSRTHRTTD